MTYSVGDLYAACDFKFSALEQSTAVSTRSERSPLSLQVDEIYSKRHDGSDVIGTL